MIRQACLDEAAGISALIKAAYQGYVEKLGRNPQPMDDSYADLIAAKQVWINKREGELAGVLVCQITDDHLLVRTVGILPEYQGCGLGSELMKYAETLARDAAIGVMRLYTNEVMTGNVEFYEWLGYLETHRKGPDAKQVVYMMKVL